MHHLEVYLELLLGKNITKIQDRPKKRGRPKKVDLDTGRSGTPVMNGRQPITQAEAFKVFNWKLNHFGKICTF